MRGDLCVRISKGGKKYGCFTKNIIQDFDFFKKITSNKPAKLAICQDSIDNSNVFLLVRYNYSEFHFKISYTYRRKLVSEFSFCISMV